MPPALLDNPHPSFDRIDLKKQVNMGGNLVEMAVKDIFCSSELPGSSWVSGAFIEYYSLPSKKTSLSIENEWISRISPSEQTIGFFASCLLLQLC